MIALENNSMFPTKSGVPPNDAHVGNRKHLVNCNDCRFIFNIINIYTLRIVLPFFVIFCFAFFFVESPQTEQWLINSKPTAKDSFGWITISIPHQNKSFAVSTRHHFQLSFRMHTYTLHGMAWPH